MATTTYLAHNVIGGRREDYLKVVMGGAETVAVLNSRMSKIDSIDVQQDGASPDRNVNFVVVSKGTFSINGAAAAHTYRIRVIGR